MSATSHLTARASTRPVPDLDACPFCGGETLKAVPLLDRIKKARGPAVGGSVSIRKSGEEYLKCNGCMTEFVHAERDIEVIMKGLMVRPNILAQIKYCYGRAVKVSDPLTRHRTAIVRRVHARRSLLGVSVAKKELIICFKYRGVRTFGSFIREADRRRGARYVFAELSMA